MANETDIKIENICDEMREPVPDYCNLPEGWQVAMLDMFDQGFTNEEIISWIAKVRHSSFSVATFYRWYHEIPAFRKVVEIGNIYKKAWWLKQGRVNIGSPKFNTPLYIRLMANLFGWSTESSQIESVGDKTDLSKLDKEELEIYRKLRDKMRNSGNGGNGVVKKSDNASADTAGYQPVFAGSGRD